MSTVDSLNQLKSKPEEYWTKRGDRVVLDLFKKMSRNVPAYKDFLKKNKIDPIAIKTINDFKSIPTIGKANYLRVYPRRSLCWDGEFAGKNWVISTTSGSTGEPFYFPRDNSQDLQYALALELMLTTNFGIDEKSTLFIVGFPMGVWIGGLFTYQALKMIQNLGKYKLSIITPGISKAEISKALKNLGHEFDQVIIGSYGPFLKDALDDGPKFGVNWQDYNLKFVFAAEGFSEQFRDYVIEKAGLKNPYKDTLNIYGTVDLGTMAHETPLSVLIRRLAVKNPNLFKEIFGNIDRLPTLCQYIPELFYFESIDGNLICSAESGYPLIRYDLKDHGGVIGYSEMMEKLLRSGVDIDDQVDKAGISDTVFKAPFVYVYERSDFSVSFFAFQIYPETVRKALQAGSLKDQITGKFTMLIKYNKKGGQIFEINVELKEKIKEGKELKKQVRNTIQKKLLEENSEYRKTYEEYPKKVIPKVIFWDYENPKYFRPGGKQQWVQK